jgi:glycerol-3-phosphate dehydrogenase
LVRKALQERHILKKLAPHLIHPQEFIMPHEKHLRPAWLIRLGLFIYDHLAAHPGMPNSKIIRLKNSILLTKFKLGFSYYDCATDDARLVILNALAAKNNSARILTQTKFITALYQDPHWKITYQPNDSKTPTTCYAKTLVNAGGPWVSALHSQLLPQESPLVTHLVKGSHIAVPKLYEGNHAYLLQNHDKRIVFVIPYEDNFSLIGTTDAALDSTLDAITINADETTYLCNTINHYFTKKITASDVVWSYAGVRTLQSDQHDKLSKITRDYKIELHTSLPLLTVVSGKLTTYRCLAKDAIDSLKTFLPSLKDSKTDKLLLPGGNITNGNSQDYLIYLTEKFSFLPHQLIKRYARNYGTLSEIILANTSCLADLGIDFSNTLYEKEVMYLIKHEWATCADDILWRRSKLGLVFTNDQTDTLNKWIKNFTKQ